VFFYIASSCDYFRKGHITWNHFSLLFLAICYLFHGAINSNGDLKLEINMGMEVSALQNLSSNIKQLNHKASDKAKKAQVTAPGLDPRQVPSSKVKDKSAIIGLTIDTSV